MDEGISRRLSINTPTKEYYSNRGKVPCPSCKTSVKLSDLVEKRGIITCRECNRI